MTHCVNKIVSNFIHSWLMMHKIYVIDVYGISICHRCTWHHNKNIMVPCDACTKLDTKTSSTTFDWLSVATNQIRYPEGCYRIAENIGGSKNWRIWQKDDCSPNFGAPKWMLDVIHGLQVLKRQNYINNLFCSFAKILSLQFYPLYGIFKCDNKMGSKMMKHS